MLPSTKVIKDTARKQMKNNWVQVIIVTAVLLLAIILTTVWGSMILALLSGIRMVNGPLASAVWFLATALSTALSLCMVMPLVQGVVRWFWFLGLDKELPLSEAFYYFSEWSLFLKSLILGLRFLGSMVIASFVCYLPTVAAMTLTKAENASINVTLLKVLAILLFLLGSVIIIKVALCYSLAPIAIIINPELQPHDAIDISKKIVSANRGACLFTVLSFIGYLLLSIFGVTLIYTLPFMLTSYSVFARFLITGHRFESARYGVKQLI